MIKRWSQMLPWVAIAVSPLFGVSPALADEGLLQMMQTVRHRQPVPPNLRSQTKTFSSSTAPNSFNQVTNVSELKDVAPTAWAYEALRSLVERYGCIVGYPDRSFRGDRALSRWEFAAGLNACINTMERLLQENVAVLKADLDKLKRLAEEFRAELDALGVRIDNLEVRVAYLEDHSFATTTKLFGETQVVFSGVGGNEAANGPPGSPITNGQITANYQTRLNFDTSFSGEDRLRVRLRAANFQAARGGTNLTDFNFYANTDGAIQLQKVQYRFPVGENLTLWAAPVRITLDDVSDPLAPYTNSLTDGAIAFFGAIAPMYLIGDDEGPGLAALYEFTDELNLGVMYSATNGNDPSPGKGFFNGTYQVATQLTYAPSPTTGVAFAYSHAYFANGFVDDGTSVLGFEGVANSDAPFGNLATSADNFALVWTWQLLDWLSMEGWGMYTNASGDSGDRQGDTADIWNWKFSLAFPNLFRESNVGVITVGQPPYASNITNRNDIADALPSTVDTPWLFEVFYLHTVNDNISITPGVTYIINPENGRDPIWVGTVRTSFKF